MYTSIACHTQPPGPRGPPSQAPTAHSSSGRPPPEHAPAPGNPGSTNARPATGKRNTAHFNTAGAGLPLKYRRAAGATSPNCNVDTPRVNAPLARVNATLARVNSPLPQPPLTPRRLHQPACAAAVPASEGDNGPLSPYEANSLRTPYVRADGVRLHLKTEAKTVR
eukprot:1176930-Prorocentrum_minimum.AAC.1